MTFGFVNCHVHFTERVWAHAASQPASGLQPELDDMFLSRGFTTAFDLSSNPTDTLALKRRIESNELRGPRVLTAGVGLLPANGVPFYVRDSVPRHLALLMPRPVTPLGAHLAVATQTHRGAELVKLFTASYVSPTRVKPMRFPIARAAVRSAHRRGLRVFAHPSNRAGIEIAVKAGVDALAHLPDDTQGTQELLEQAAMQGVRVVPTLHMFSSTVTSDEAYLRPISEALRHFRAHGGKVLFGTDVGYMPDRDTRPEFTAMASAGMNATDILASLTTEPAAFLSDRHAGRVAPGYRGDLTVLETTATTVNPTDFADIHMVVRGGHRLWAAGEHQPA
uniref:amidohydrolase family protein n=1 Tax=Microbacterium azadirachtae TaxID=582680 RepID=UPI001587F133|nr:amidohydrolase family protein [Microbacterium azadirachtae]